MVISPSTLDSSSNKDVFIATSIVVGIISALGIILTSPSMMERYGLLPVDAPHKLDNPAVISFSLALLTLVIVSLLTQKDNKKLEEAKAAAK